MMKKTTPLVAAVTLGAATALALAAPLAASAHVTVTPSNTAASRYSVLTFSVGHGCDGSATTGVTFTIPDSIESVTPTVNPGWTIEKSATQVSYTAAEPLVDGLRTTFELSVRLPELPAGETLALPVLQTCEVGQIDWAELSTGDIEPDYPAPSIVLTAASADGHGDDGTATENDDAVSGTPADSEHAATSDAESATTASTDVLARVLGILGLVVGAVGVVIAVLSRRSAVS